MRRRAFTLIEILVVLALIAILTALLFPVFASAREASRITVCSANLRQVGTAVTLYLQDYDDLFPPAWVEGPRSTWVGQLGPYVKHWGLFRCPNMAEAAVGTRSIWSTPLYANTGNLSVWQGFGLNVDYLAFSASDCATYDLKTLSGPPTALGAVAQPSATVLAVGISLAAGPGSWAGRNTLYPERGGWALAPAPATIGSRDACTHPSGGWGQGGYLGPSGGFEAPRHGGRGNVLFVDGHLKPMKPEQLAAGTDWTPTAVNTEIQITDRSRYLWDLQ